jgi:hypothetical protein
MPHFVFIVDLLHLSGVEIDHTIADARMTNLAVVAAALGGDAFRNHYVYRNTATAMYAAALEQYHHD